MVAYVVLAALQAAAVTAAAPVAPAAATAPPVVTVANNTDNKMICKQEDEIGTRLGGHKVCMTKVQWRESARQDRDAVKHAQDSRGYFHN